MRKIGRANQMKVTVKFPNKKLRKKLDNALKMEKYWRDLCYKQNREQSDWCDDMYGRICAILTPQAGFDSLDTAVTELLNAYVKLGGKAIEPNKDIEGFPRCPNKDCRKPLSRYWKHCPGCGSKLK
jgi:hypothetical protein